MEEADEILDDEELIHWSGKFEPTWCIGCSRGSAQDRNPHWVFALPLRMTFFGTLNSSGLWITVPKKETALVIRTSRLGTFRRPVGPLYPR